MGAQRHPHPSLTAGGLGSLDSGVESLLEAIGEAPEPPCMLGGGCPFQSRCATEGLACREFYLYSRLQPFQDNHLGLSLPTKALYESIYSPPYKSPTRGRSYRSRLAGALKLL